MHDDANTHTIPQPRGDQDAPTSMVGTIDHSMGGQGIAQSREERGLTDKDWKVLVERIESKRCTPFLGAGACHGVLELGSTIARSWSKELECCLDDVNDLARVAQFLGIHYNDKVYPKERILKELGIRKDTPRDERKWPDFSKKDEPHGVLAQLPIPIYITTNYDDFMLEALKFHGKSEARRELCRWNDEIGASPSIFSGDVAFRPTPEKPLVFHLHGHNENEDSLVLTEDDYLDFLVSISRDPSGKEARLLPPLIEGAIGGNSLMFIGYRLADWSFRVLYRGLVSSKRSNLRRTSVTVQLPPEDLLQPTDVVLLSNGDRVSGKLLREEGHDVELETQSLGTVKIDKRNVLHISYAQEHEESAKARQEAAKRYLRHYFEDMDIKVYWGKANEFVKELLDRWTASRPAN